MCHECGYLFRDEDTEGVSPYARFTDCAKETLRTSYLEDNLSSRQVSKRMARDFHLKADHVTVLRTSKKDKNRQENLLHLLRRSLHRRPLRQSGGRGEGHHNHRGRYREETPHHRDAPEGRPRRHEKRPNST
nr:hypothetical protein [Candidatus Freyarchaeota archaeon]